MKDTEIIRSLERDINSLRSSRGYLYAGRPRFTNLFGRDSLISAWQLLSYDPAIARDTLICLAQLQGTKTNPENEEEPGKIPHEYFAPARRIYRLFNRLRNPAIGLPRYNPSFDKSIDATPLWLTVFAAYVQMSGDTATRDRLWPNALRAVEWLLTIADHDGDGFFDFFSHRKDHPEQHWWRDSQEFSDLVHPVAPVEMQGYAYAALTQFAALAAERNEHAQADRARQRAEKLKAQFAASAFVQEGYLAFALHDSGRPAEGISSNMGHVLGSGLLSDAHRQMVTDRLLRDDFWTPYGMRTVPVGDIRFHWNSYHNGAIWPHDNWFVWRALHDAGDTVRADRVAAALARAFTKLGGKLPELYLVDADAPDAIALSYTTTEGTFPVNCPQAWASGALLAMLSAQQK